MAWVAVDKSGGEYIFDNRPGRSDNQWEDIDYSCYGESYMEVDTAIVLPKGTIKKLIGRELTWEDNPVELMEE